MLLLSLPDAWPSGIIFYLLIKFLNGQLSQTSRLSLTLPEDVGDAGLCANQSDHSLQNVSGFYHTPWLDKAFCSYPPTPRRNALLENSGDECFPTDNTVLDKLLFMCDVAVGKRSREIYTSWKLEFCSDYSIERVFGSKDDCIFRGEKDECRKCMENIYNMDEYVKVVYCHFIKDIMARFDCETRYSVKWECNDCEIAYRQWLCAMMIPLRMGEYLIKPCTTFCTMVEQRCPYLTPDDRVIYAGEAVFFCKDPDVPELYSAYTEPPHCYQPCHLTGDRTGLCLHHELLQEELAEFYNMSRKRSSSSSSRSFSIVFGIQTVIIHFLNLNWVYRITGTRFSRTMFY